MAADRNEDTERARPAQADGGAGPDVDETVEGDDPDIVWMREFATVLESPERSRFSSTAAPDAPDILMPLLADSARDKL